MAEKTRICSERGQILGEFSEAMPRGKARGELLAIKRGAQRMALEREVGPDRSSTRTPVCVQEPGSRARFAGSLLGGCGARVYAWADGYFRHDCLAGHRL
jgi:hypothetical protein